MFYVVIFSILAVVLVVTGVVGMSRRRRNLERDEGHMATKTDTKRRNRKMKRAQSRQDRRKRQ